MVLFRRNSIVIVYKNDLKMFLASAVKIKKERNNFILHKIGKKQKQT